MIDKEMTLKLLRERRRAGLPVNDAGLQREDRSLYAAAIRYFGNISNALKAIGIDPVTVQQCVRYDFHIAAILIEAGEMTKDFGFRNFERSTDIIRLIRRHYGGWLQFARAHGLRDAVFSCSSYADIGEIEKGLADFPPSINGRALRRANRPLYRAIERIWQRRDVSSESRGKFLPHIRFAHYNTTLSVLLLVSFFDSGLRIRIFTLLEHVLNSFGENA